MDWFLKLNNEVVEFEVVKKQRTSKQQAAIEVYCRELAGAMNDAGFDMTTFPYREGFKLKWTQESVKQTFWKPTQRHLFGKKSSTQLNTSEVSEVYEAVDLGISQNTGVSIEFPHREE